MIKFRVWFEESVLKKAHMVDWEELKEFKGLSRLFDDAPHSESFSLMQSTGLKDLKGVEIFEGDVVWIIDKGEMDNGWGWFEEVKFRNGSFMAGDDFLVNSHHRCVVHGNIYEQPELLGVAQ